MNIIVFFLEFSDFPLYRGILLQAISGVYSPQVSVFCSGVIYREIHVHQPFTTLLTGFFPSVVATAITSSAHFDNGAHGTAEHRIWYRWTPEQHDLLMRDQAWQLAYHRNPETI